jgi:ABC-type multidrug transport system fused ATPase/permease subunit
MGFVLCNVLTRARLCDVAFSNIRTVRSFSKEDHTSKMYGSAIEKTYQIGKKISFISGVFQGGIGFIPQAAIASVVWYGGTLVLSGELTTGLLTSFMLYTISVAMVRPNARCTPESSFDSVSLFIRRLRSFLVSLENSCRLLEPVSAFWSW